MSLTTINRLRVKARKLEAENKQLKKALADILASWDKGTRGDREQFKGIWVGGTYVEYWSPAASLVDSAVIAEARKLL